MLRDAPRVYPGVQELVRQLRGRVRLAVVAGAWRENIEVVLSTSGLLAAFELIVGKEDVRSVEPDPEAYLLALSRLGRSARRNRGDRGFSNRPGRRPCRRDPESPRHRREFGGWVGDSTYFSGLEPVSGLLRHLGLET